MPRRVLRLMCSLALVGFAACGDGEPAAGGSPSPEPTSPQPASPSPIIGACEAEPRTAVSSGWQQHQSPSGSYVFSYPAEWEDLTGQVSYDASEVVTEETLSEAGVGPDTQVGATLVRDPAGTTNLTVFEFEGVTSTTDVVYQRQEERIQALTAIQEILGTRITACAAGETALGLEFSFSAPREDTGETATFFQRNMHVVREGTLYVIQILAPRPRRGRDPR